VTDLGLAASRVIAVAGTSHSPMVTLDPELIWPARALTDVTNPALYDNNGAVRAYDDLVAEAAGRYDAELDRAVWAAKHALAITSIERLGRDLLALEPDLVIPVGDDQKEMYDFDNFPAVSLYYGAEVRIVPPPSREPTLPSERAVRLMQGLDGSVHPGDPDAGRRLVQELTARDFDVAAGSKIRDHGPHQGFGHAVAFVLVRLLRSSGIPCVPVLLNTYFPPNQPSPRRCVGLGQALAAAVRTLPGGRRAVVIASGGLSHFVIDAALDAALLDAMRAGDLDALAALPADRMNSGTSEGRNWLVAAGAGGAEELKHQWSEYIPAYRSPAGTGTGLAFGLWC
jgi:Catalytic LigB subunit of aromatic ring-opening dioxygenase